MRQIGPTFDETAVRAALRAMGLITLAAIMAANQTRSALRGAVPVVLLAALLALPPLVVALLVWLR